jgi:hypothetical protein
MNTNVYKTPERPKREPKAPGAPVKRRPSFVEPFRAAMDNMVRDLSREIEAAAAEAPVDPD